MLKNELKNGKKLEDKKTSVAVKKGTGTVTKHSYPTRTLAKAYESKGRAKEHYKAGRINAKKFDSLMLITNDAIKKHKSRLSKGKGTHAWS